jgi:uncharacterized protein
VPTTEREIALGGHACLVIRPRGARALYVLGHGAGAGMRHAFMSAIAGALAEVGIATVRYEFPAMAAGRPRPDKPEVCAQTIRAVFAATAAKFSGLPLIAGGKSFGGRMTSNAHAAEPLPGLRGLCFLGFPLHPPDKPAITRAEHLARAPGPMLFLSGTRDELAELALLRPVVAALGPRATLHEVAGADHGFAVQRRSGRRDADVLVELATTTAGWLDSLDT